MTDMTNLTTQQIHQLGVDSAITASRYHNDALNTGRSGLSYFVNGYIDADAVDKVREAFNMLDELVALKRKLSK